MQKSLIIWHLKIATKLSFLTTEMTHPTQLLYHITSFCWHEGILWTVFLSCSHLSPHHLGVDSPSLTPSSAELSPRNRRHLYECTGGTNLLLNSSQQTHPWCNLPNERVNVRSGQEDLKHPPRVLPKLGSYQQGTSFDDTIKRRNKRGSTPKKNVCHYHFTAICSADHRNSTVWNFNATVWAVAFY